MTYYREEHAVIYTQLHNKKKRAREKARAKARKTEKAVLGAQATAQVPWIVSNRRNTSPEDTTNSRTHARH